MNNLKSITLAFFAFTLPIISKAQTPSENLSNLKYYLYEAQSNMSNAKYYVHDSLKMTSLLDSTEALIQKLINASDAIVLPEPPPAEAPTVVEIDSDTSDIYTEKDWDFGKGSFPDFNPFKKIKSHFLVEVGINNLLRSSHTGIIPEISPGKSWFWNFGLTREVPLSKTFDLNFGFTYMMNNFSFGNDVIITTDENTGLIPSFEKIEDIKKEPCLNVHYLTIPLTLDIKLSKQLKLNLGGFGGYRVYTAQKYTIREKSEDVEITRKDNFGLNNWIYGARGGIGFGAWDIFTEYRVSNIFRIDNVQNYNVFLIGTAWRI